MTNPNNTREDVYSVIVKTDRKQLEKAKVSSYEELIGLVFSWSGDDDQIVSELLGIEIDQSNLYLNLRKGNYKFVGVGKTPESYPCIVVFYYGALQYLTFQSAAEKKEYDAERRPDIEYIYPDDF